MAPNQAGPVYKNFADASRSYLLHSTASRQAGATDTRLSTTSRPNRQRPELMPLGSRRKPPFERMFEDQLLLNPVRIWDERFPELNITNANAAREE